MENAIAILISLFGGVGLLFVAYLVGSSVEAAHFRKLAQWEQELSGIMVSDMKRVPPNWHVAEASLVVGEAVIATDKFKVFTAGLRNLFGGRIRGYETLMERARRQAIVRMLWHAQRYGANVVWNIRIETSTIQGKREGKSGGVEVMAYGTAMKVRGQ